MTLSGLNEAAALIVRLRKSGVALWEDSGKLKYRAPQGVLDNADLLAMKQWKADILECLQSEAEAEVAIVQHRPESKFELFPLTEVQEAYLLGRSNVFEYGGVACHIYMEIRYDELEHGRVEAAWNKLIARHDMLRAVIDKNGYQKVLEHVPWLDIPYFDESSGEDAAEARLNELREDMRHRVYDTEQWPLFGLAVTKAADRAVLHVSIEFLIADWTSIWKLLSEFEALYDNPELKLKDSVLSFRDYLIAERGLRETDAYTRDKNYWLQRIDSLPPAPDLPLAKSQSDEGKARFWRHSLRMDIEKWTALKQNAQKRGLTPTIAVMAAYATVIERWSRNDSFSLNLTVLNRLPLHPDVNEIVGDFTSVSLLAVESHAGRTFAEQAKAMSARLFEDLDHRLFSGVEVLRERARRSGRDAALMPIVFTSAIGLLESARGSLLRGAIEPNGISQTAQVFIDCQAMDGATGLQVNWDVREGVFPEGLTHDMFEAFEKLLQALAENGGIWESSEPVALPDWQIEERQQINDTAAPLPDRMLHSAILEQITMNPGRIALIDSKERLSYGELGRRASATAKVLLAADCCMRNNIAIVMDGSVHQAVAVLAALSVGAVYIPIDPAQPVLRRNAILKNTLTRHILTSTATGITDWPSAVTVIEVDRLEPCDGIELVDAYDPDMPAYIIYTSGSTGQPKGVVITHRAAANTVQDINSRFHVGQDDKVLALAKLSFDLSVYDLFGILSVGGTVVYPSSHRQTDPSHWAELMEEHGVTIWNSVPALIQMLVEYLNREQTLSLCRFRLAMLSGDWIPLSLPDALIERVPSVQLVGLGGATEASIWSNFHIYRGLQPDWSSIPYGRPLANQGFRVLNERLLDCPIWSAGELYITGAGLAEGYYGDRELTSARFFHHPIDGTRLYRTGDMGRYLPGGEIQFLGREDSQVKIRGHRIELGEIEAALSQHAEVAHSIVIAGGSGSNRSLFGVVELVHDAERKPDQPAISAAELVTFVAAQLPAYMVPSALRIVESFPLTPNGKIDRKKIAEWQEMDAAGASMVTDTDDAARDPLEQQLARIWAEELGVPSVGRTQNLYHQGADSLIMARVAGKLREQLTGNHIRNDIPFDAVLRQILNFPTVADLAAYIRSSNAEAGADASSANVNDSARVHGSNAVLTSYGGGETGPLRVVFHAGLGTMNGFGLLLSHMQKQNIGPIVGITIADSDQYCAVDASGLIESLADDYAQRLFATGHGQMQLIGYSLGGLVAVETARRLLESGVRIVDLVLVDSHPILYPIEDELVIESLLVPNLHLTLEQAGFGGVRPDDFTRGLRQVFEAHGNRLPDKVSLTIGGDESLEQVGAMFRHLASFSPAERYTRYSNAVAKYHGADMPAAMIEGIFKTYRQSLQAARIIPRPYMGNIRFLLAAEPLSLLPGTDETTLQFWRDMCFGELSVTTIAGNHYTCIETEPNAGELAKLIGEVLVLC